MSDIRIASFVQSIVFTTVFLASAILIALFAMAIGDRRPPLDTITDTIVVGGGFAPGEDVILETKVERHRQCPVQVQRIFVDSRGVRFVLQEYEIDRALPLGVTLSRPVFTIPRLAASGVGQYHSTLLYSCNPLQRVFFPIIVEGAEVPVTVIRRD